jgi:DnaJ homolog subfamily C member 9
MSHAADILEAAFGRETDLYQILKVPRDATPAQLRKAYYRSSLQCHPDKVSGKESQFHALTVAYHILKDPETRASYDETGELIDPDDDENDPFSRKNSDSFEAMKNYFSAIFGNVTTSKIDAFAEKYKCSEEEQADVLKYYVQFQGHSGKMLENVMLSSEPDVHRWIEDYIQPAIQSKQIPDYLPQMRKTLKRCIQKAEKIIQDDDVDDDRTVTDDDQSDTGAATSERTTTTRKRVASFREPTNKSRRITKAQREAEQADALLQKIKDKSKLSRRQQGFDNMLAELASKYGGTNVDDDPLDEESFSRLQSKMVRNSKKMKK